MDKSYSLKVINEPTEYLLLIYRDNFQIAKCLDLGLNLNLFQKTLLLKNTGPRRDHVILLCFHNTQLATLYKQYLEKECYSENYYTRYSVIDNATSDSKENMSMVRTISRTLSIDSTASTIPGEIYIPFTKIKKIIKKHSINTQQATSHIKKIQLVPPPLTIYGIVPEIPGLDNKARFKNFMKRYGKIQKCWFTKSFMKSTNRYALFGHIRFAESKEAALTVFDQDLLYKPRFSRPTK